MVYRVGQIAYRRGLTNWYACAAQGQHMEISLDEGNRAIVIAESLARVTILTETIAREISQDLGFLHAGLRKRHEISGTFFFS